MRKHCGFICLSILALSTYCLAQGVERPKYLDPTVPIEQRIDDLLPRMTLEEKIGQVVDSWGAKPIPRLKVPSLLKTEGLHSQSYSTGATIFPHAIAMAATFDPDLVWKIGKRTALEAKAAHIRASWSPVLDVARDVRWGRVEETYGESPFLVSRMGVSWINGFQSEGMIAIPKHFAGHGQPEGGRDSQDLGLSDRTMREIHLPGFRAAVEDAHAGGIMAAYGVWEGVPDNASTTLLQKILREEWGFDGMVVSDCGAIEHFAQKHAVTDTMAKAAALAVVAGVNMECGGAYKSGALAEAVKQGLVTEVQLDELVRPTLRVKFRLGLFEHPEQDKMVWEKLPAYDTPEARALARQVAVESTVLLRNENRLLPLSKGVKTVAVIGPNADTAQIGDYSPKIAPGQLVTVLQGIKNHVGPATQVVYAAGLPSPTSTDTSRFAEAAAAARSAEVAVVVVGDNSRPGGGESTTGENRDGATLEFPGAQRELIQAIHAAGTPVVLVIVNGKPFTLAWEAVNIPSILVTWYPGEEGGNAVADLLFGDKNPSGRLPLTWPRHVGQLPLHYDYHPSGRRYDYYDMAFTPQYRFGYGLSYSQFKYSNLRITPKQDDQGFVAVAADVENVGTYDGDEAAQLYVTDAVASVSTPVAQLQGVQRVSLRKGEKKTVRFELTPYQLSLLDASMVRRVEPGLFRIHVGGVSPDVASDRISADRKAKIGYLDASQGISGEFTEPREYSARFEWMLDVPQRVASRQPFDARVSVTNKGNLTDVTEVRLYAGHELGSWSFEVRPGETKSHTFQVALENEPNIAAVAGSQMIVKPVTFGAVAPGRLRLQNLQVQVDGDNHLRVSADSANVGGEQLAEKLTLKVDGQVVKEALVTLQAGEKQAVSLHSLVKVGGVHRVQLNDLPEQTLVVPGGIGLAIANPLVHLKLDEHVTNKTKDEVTGAELPVSGTVVSVAGKSGRALRFAAPDGSIHIPDTNLYRKAFTLSARVRVERLVDQGDLALFGGRAPMGAGQDNTGTQLSAGVHRGKAYMSFGGLSISGSKDIVPGRWIDVTYTYDPATEKGSLYIDEALDTSAALKPYLGPLDTIGNAPELQHGSYVLDEVIILEQCLAPAAVKTLVSQGLAALQEGEYVSEWRTAENSAAQLETSAELPAGAKTSLIVERMPKNGKAAETTIAVEQGQHTYSVPAGAAGDRVRLHVQISGADRNSSPLLRSVSLGSLHWTTPNEWKNGVLTGGAVRDGQK